ncbi:hypothetical protein Tco_1256964 [Tanacetum coccineum]
MKYNSEVSITDSKKPKLFEAKDSTLSNHDTDKSVAPPSSTREAGWNLPQPLLRITKKALQLMLAKVKDDPPLAIAMKELNELKLQLSKKKLSHFRNYQPQQHHTGQGESSLRSRPSRLVISFPSCIHCGYNDHQSDDCVYYPRCELCRSYDHDNHGHNRIISLRRGIKPRNPQHVTKNCETCGSNVHTTSDHKTLSSSGKEKLFKLRKLSLLKQGRLDHQVL